MKKGAIFFTKSRCDAHLKRKILKKSRYIAKMEYRILGLRENATMDDAKKALKAIRVEYHPDKHTTSSSREKKRAAHFLSLAEEAYERIEQKRKVDETMHHLRQNLFPFASFPISTVHTPLESESIQYTYQNINGRVREYGTVNGRPMTESELNKIR